MADSSQLIESLYALAKKNSKLVKSSKYQAPADKNVVVSSWKMNEFKYYDIPSPFPTLARGLFTTEADQTEQSDIKHRIVARGYDKFFNIGEVPWTNWGAIYRHTTAPYTLTLKSNGCIIFIAALTPDKLIVTSKHSIGPVQGSPESHAEVGERWLLQHLASVNKTPEQLAATLWEKNWTAVSELCDDSFEEHVLPIPSDMTGLHLHGLNANVGEFATQDQPIVDAFAEEWGFIKTASIVLNTSEEVREFTQSVGKTGKWNDVAVEGFVVRTTIGPRPSESFKDTPPYEPGSSFFFKVKFDEPYMMYRDWREITKSLLTAHAKGNINDARVSKARLRRKETVVYKNWVTQEIKRNPGAFKDYQKNRGIVAVRDNFFKWLESNEGKDATKIVDVPDQPAPSDRSKKVVIVPVAVPGCGKTTISIALSYLFGFGHTQSDDIKAKKAAPIFERNIVDLLKNHDVVIADRNNHLTQHRAGIRSAVSKTTPPPRLIGLYWPTKGSPAGTIQRLVSERILNRGDNHQSLRPNEENLHEQVVWRFLKDADELAEGELDDVIEMEVDETFENSLAKAVNELVDLLGLEPPSEEERGKAIRIAMEYKTSTKRGDTKNDNKDVQVARAPEPSKGAGKKKGKPPRYFAIVPEVDLSDVMSGIINDNPSIPDDAKLFLERLKTGHRLAAQPHITLTHVSRRDEEGAAWDACEKLVGQSTKPSFQFRFSNLIWNDRVMALAVEDVRLHEGDADSVTPFLESLGSKVINRLHVTVGTAKGSIPPVEALELVEAWRAGKRNGLQVFDLNGVTANGQVKGRMA